MAVALAGCVQFTSVKDIAKDKPGYLAANFNVETLPTSLQQKLPAAGSHPLPFKILKITGTMNGHMGANAYVSDFKSTLVNAKDSGLVQQLNEVSANGIPSAASFSLSYLNWYFIKQETTSYFQQVAPQAIVAHEIDPTAFDLSKPQEDQNYTVTLTVGTAVQIVNFKTVISTCHTGKYYPAANVVAGLQGQAIDLNCEDSKDGILQGTSRRTLLSEYGVYVMRSSATAAMKFDWQYTGFEKDGRRESVDPSGHDKAA